MNNEDNSAAEDGCDTLDYWPVLTTVAQADKRSRTLSMFVELSFLAGRDGDATDDWRADMLGALDKAFPSIRPPRRDELERTLTAAYYAGCDQAAIDGAARPERAMRFAQAKATLHELHYAPADGARTAALEARATAYLLAHKLPIGADEAAACAIDALSEAGFVVPAKESSFVLEGAGRGVEEREAWEAAEREYRQSEDSILDSILNGEVLA